MIDLGGINNGTDQQRVEDHLHPLDEKKDNTKGLD